MISFIYYFLRRNQTGLMEIYLSKINFKLKTEKKLMQKKRGFLFLVLIVNLFQVGKSKALNLVVAVEMWKEIYNFL